MTLFNCTEYFLARQLGTPFFLLSWAETNVRPGTRTEVGKGQPPVTHDPTLLPYRTPYRRWENVNEHRPVHAYKECNTASPGQVIGLATTLADTAIINSH